MPIYEFKCNLCGHEFDKLTKINDNLAEIVCPQCGGQDAKKRISLCGCAQKGGQASASCGSCSSNNCSSCGH